jgi:hypothetical protein
MVAISMSVDDPRDRRLRQYRFGMLKHLTREVKIPASIDQYGLPAAVDKPEIGFSPASVRHHPSESILGDFVQALRESWHRASARYDPSGTDRETRTDHHLTP